MAALLKHYFNIAFLMGKPQDLPAGERQLYIAVGLNFVTYIAAMLNFSSFGMAVKLAAVDLALSGVCLYIGLTAVGRLPRFQQSYGALCGAGAILNLAAIPLLALPMTPEGGSPSTFLLVSFFVYRVWGLSVVGHVLRHTFSLKMATSIAIAVLYYILITSVLASVFPPEAASEIMGENF